MKKLLSLPSNLVECFHDIRKVDRQEWFCTSDPENRKLGSGGGTAWLLEACRQAEGTDRDFADWLGREKRVLIHAGGQSRRLPAYAPSGKVLTPVPVFRWARGQRLSQDLLSLQLPLYERILEKAPASLRTLVASGDVYIRAEKPLQEVPEVDVVCYGLWADSVLAQRHGVFAARRADPGRLDFMLQKPSADELDRLMQTHLFLMDVGVWLLSDRAVRLLAERSRRGGELVAYDLYAEFGTSLGAHPRRTDREVNALSVAVLPLPGGEFYHYGTSRELITSTLAVQNRVTDQREIMHRKVKPHPAMFVQNADVAYRLTADNAETWIENSCVGTGWTLRRRHLVTGIPANDWRLDLPEGVCVDAVPVGQTGYAARPYGYEDPFRGALADPSTLYQGRPFAEWCARRGLETACVEGGADLQTARLFPVCASVDELGIALRWMTSEPDLAEGKVLWERSRKLSADELSACADLRRLTAQREAFRAANWPALARNHERSVFYQLNLADAADEFAAHRLPLPEPLANDAPLLARIGDRMFRARVRSRRGLSGAEADEAEAFRLMREELTAATREDKQRPRLSVYPDQIVWARSPVRVDLAGGWTDTPPYCLSEGGSVVNLAVELNGQPPLQVYVKTRRDCRIVLRSIDLGASETVPPTTNCDASSK